ncbi:MAG: hypothetical protein ACFFBX_08910 [Promethearchaeota archaeon]
MRKELRYEFTAVPPAQKAFKCLCDRLSIQPRQEDMSGGLIARSADRAFVARLLTEKTARGTTRIEVEIRLATEEQMAAVVACFGEPEKERKIAPSAKSFAKIIVETELTDDRDAFIAEVCGKLEIPPDRFGSYRAMVLSTSKTLGVPEVVKQAAEKLKAL